MSSTTHYFPAREDALAGLLEFVEASGRDWQLPPETLLKLRLIAEELFTNSARCGAPGEHVAVSIGREEDRVSFRYEDSGIAQNPFDRLDRGHLTQPVADRPIGRLGLVLIDGLAEDVSYERRGGRNCFLIRLKD
ncbi:MAG TPA: ATP-binding protein [Solimonas sp.]|nr:ATP-binding protein [Solimonas sp.]